MKTDDRMVLLGFGKPIHGRRMPWRSKKGTPGAVRQKYFYCDGNSYYWDWKDGHAPSWVDHEYKFKSSCGDEFYISEPYGLGDNAIADLAKLASEGWVITVSANSGYGHGTVRVLIESQDQQRRRWERDRRELLEARNANQ